MKVLYGYKFGILGGVCTQLVNRLRVLRASGRFDAQLVFWKDLGITKTLGPHIARVESDPKRFRELAEAGDFDVVVVIDTPEYLEALAGFAGRPVVIEVHTTIERGLRYLKGAHWECAGYIVPSAYSEDLLRQRFGIGQSVPVLVVPNSLDFDLFPAVDGPDPGGRPIIAWVGKLDDHKNWRGFVATAGRIAASGLDAEYWLAGGETAPVTLQDALIDELERQGVAARARWFPRIEYEAMHRMYAAVRQSGGAVVVTSLDESFGMSVLESLVCGCPVAATRVGALPEIAPGQPYLAFYTPGDVDAAARAVLELVDPDGSRELRAQLIRDREGVLATYSSEVVGPRYVEALARLARPEGC